MNFLRKQDTMSMAHPRYSDNINNTHDDQDLEEESLLIDVEKDKSNGHMRKPHKKSSRYLALDLKWWLAVNLLLTSFNLAGLIALNILWRSAQSHSPHQDTSSHNALPCATEQVLPPSPAIHAIERELRSFSLTSKYSNHPSPETDQAWHDLVNTGAMFPLTEEEFLKVNDKPETGIKITHDPQGRYVGTLAATHQIHCVNSLRKALWFHVDHYRKINDTLFMDKDPPEEHLMHCVEMLRNAIMCFGDVSVITYNWKPGHEAPKGAFKSMHSCQKWDRIEDWRRKHNVTAQIKTLERPVGLLDVPPEKNDYPQ